LKSIVTRSIFLIVAILTATIQLSSQTFSISGTITDSTGTNPLYGASIVIRLQGDTSNRILGGAATDSLGNFTIHNVAKGNYRMRAVCTGYKPTGKRVTVNDSNVYAGKIILHQAGVLLADVEITEKQIRMTQNGDTTGFNASAYKTNPDATAEDLVNKLPGVTNDGGTVKVNGEEVKQVLVDGKPYFGDDPNAALKNIPADMVDKVQVYDKSSDQAQFTGFDDGQSKKTINIVTKKNTVNGQFGKSYAGYGTDDRYNAGLTLNLFNNARRITFLGMSNNINQQNFSMSDLTGTMGSGASGGGGGRPRMGGGSGGYSRGGQGSNFFVGQMGGITQTNSFGVNYTDDWGKKIKVSGSYFFNISDNVNNTSLSRNYYSNSDSVLYYNEDNHATTGNTNHRLNFRLEYTIDSMNSLIVTTKFTSQNTDYFKHLEGGNFSTENVRQSLIITDNASKNLAYNFGQGLTYRHRFLKPGRTITLDLGGTYNPRTGSGTYYSLNQYSNDTTLLNQTSTLDSRSYSETASLAWTEPIGKKGQLLFNYNPSMSTNIMDKQTKDFDPAANDFTLIDTTLTNNYRNIYFTHKAGINYRFNGTKTSLIFGNDFQYAILSGDETFPSVTKVDKTFENVLPNATFNYKFSQGKNLKIIYRTSTVAPSVTQLQDVVDNSNPLQLKTGNPELSQDYEHTLIAHFGLTSAEKATGFFAFLYAGLTSNYIANSTIIASNDTTVNGIFLNRGTQLTRYVNLSGYRNARGFLTYSLPLTKMKCNLSFNASGGYSQTPAMINDVVNYSRNLNIGPGVTLSSNINEKFDFTLSYNGNYNVVTNSVQTQSNTNYFSHTASLKFNCMPYKGIVVNTSLDQTYYSGLGQGYNTNYLLWNASVGYKFFKDKSLEAKLSAFDLLKQNTSITRTVTETYIEDSKTNVLQQYFMLTVTYNLKKFKKPADHNTQGKDQPAPAPQK
jgi:hypothetical protein